MLRKEAAAEKEGSETPGHGSTQVYDEKLVLRLPRFAPNGADQQRYISNSGN